MAQMKNTRSRGCAGVMMNNQPIDSARGGLSVNQPLHARGLGALGAFLGFVLHRLTILERAETLALDDRMVDEDVLAAALGGNEAEALLIVKPLDFTGGHGRPL